MDIGAILGFLPLIIKIINIIPIIQNDIRTGGSVIDTINRIAPDLLPMLQEIGGKLFPSVTDKSSAIQAGIDVIFDVDGTKWIQNALNTINGNTALKVDGAYGPMTKAAVTAYQTAKGLKADGWAGPLTSASLATDLTKVTP